MNLLLVNELIGLRVDRSSSCLVFELAAWSFLRVVSLLERDALRPIAFGVRLAADVRLTGTERQACSAWRRLDLPRFGGFTDVIMLGECEEATNNL